MRLKILVVDDEVALCNGIQKYLEAKGHEVGIAYSPVQALQYLRDNDVMVALVDLQLKDYNGIELLQEIKSKNTSIDVIMISGFGNMDNVIEAMRAGASDFLKKPFSLPEVQLAIENTIKYRDVRSKLEQADTRNAFLSESLGKFYDKLIVGKSAVFQQCIDLVIKVAKTDLTSILIQGESGTGKELIARSIHLLSSRNASSFIPVNCSSISETLFESEFFGHTKGSFTGALESRLGYFEAAQKGTLFLDEIGDIHPHIQAKFLRVLEERKVTRVGSYKEIDIDVRIISATNKDILKMTHEGRFREDLYHRLNSFVIEIPPLRERKEDIPELLEYFIHEFSRKLKQQSFKYDRHLPQYLQEYSFPGNVRELRNMVERAIILSESPMLEIYHFPYPVAQNDRPILSDAVSNNSLDMEENEKSLIIRALQQTHHNKLAAARLLNISWQSLDRRLKKYKII